MVRRVGLNRSPGPGLRGASAWQSLLGKLRPRARTLPAAPRDPGGLKRKPNAYDSLRSPGRLRTEPAGLWVSKVSALSGLDLLPGASVSLNSMSPCLSVPPRRLLQLHRQEVPCGPQPMPSLPTHVQRPRSPWSTEFLDKLLSSQHGLHPQWCSNLSNEPLFLSRF